MRTKRQKERKPDASVFHQESSGQTGPKYVYRASYCDILCGWPRRPSFKSLNLLYKGIDSKALTRTRERGSKLVHFEGALADIERIKAWAAEWVKDYREAHPEKEAKR